MKKFGLLSMAVATLALGACETLQGAGNKELIGGATGAVAGGLLGSQIGGGSGQVWAAGAGVLLGSILGAEVGRSLDKADLAYAGQATQTAHSAPIGETVAWSNPESGNAGTITPVRDGQSSVGRYCREYQQTITIGGRQEQGVGTACQNPDGTWEII